MKKILSFIHSAIGMKVIMALSGLMMILFLLGHALGNLLIFSGETSLNSYAHWLQHSSLLWIFRLGMMLLIATHLYLALRTYFLNRQARSIAYEIQKDIQLNLSAKTMMISGIIVALFIIFHLGHLTLGWIVDSETFHQLDKNDMVNVYQNVLFGFNRTWVATIYIVALLGIGLHLHHAIKSIFQTLGFHHENFNEVLFYLAPVLNLFIIGAFIVIPIAVQFGFIK